jgi:chemotaxis protein MotA
MIGTLIGLINMLASLEDPSMIGAGMATALITTFYGALLANAVFLPMAGKLELRSSEEILVKEMVIDGIMAIQSGDSPRIVEEKLKSFLSPTQRQIVEDSKQKAA